MKRFFSAILAILILAVAMSAAAETESPQVQAARQVVAAIIAGEYDRATEHFSPKLSEALSAQGLKEAYEPLVAVIGAYQNVHGMAQQERDGVQVVEIQCAYEKSGLKFTITFDGDQAAGLFLDLCAIPEVDGLERPIDNTTREEVALRPGQWDETMATLLIPEGKGPFPAVILLAGSGPQDKDGTVYANRPLYDIAEGLARLGVASIRYDKYSYAHGAQLSEQEQRTFTIQEEYVNDALAAYAVLRADGRIGDIYILGHSQGAMVTPRVMQAIARLTAFDGPAGGILLSGTPNPLWQVSLSQNMSLLPDDQYEAYKPILEAQIALANSVNTMTEEELLEKTIFGVSAYYQKDEMGVDAAQTAMENGKRLFIAQGQKDWQISPEMGIEAWKAALTDASMPVTFVLYENLNHLLMPQAGTSTSTLEDYMLPSEVSSAVIADIAAFITSK